MRKVIEYGKVYCGRYFRSFALMALQDAFDDDDFVTFIDLKTGEKRNEYAHQCELMQEDFAIEYLQCELIHKYPDWDEIVEATQVDYGNGFEWWEFEKLVKHESNWFLIERFSHLNKMTFRLREEQQQLGIVRQEIVRRMRRDDEIEN